MKLFLKILFISLLLATSQQVYCDVLAVQLNSQITINIPNEAGHQAPITEFMRRLDRIFRLFAKLNVSAESKKVTLEISPAQLPGTVSFQQRGKSWIVLLPMELHTLTDSPEGGRILTAALLQARLGNPPQQPLPQEALWIADGIWAEFTSREHSGDAILYFTWLPGLRNMVSRGYPLNLNAHTLTPPPQIRSNSAPWALYTERARLLVELSSNLAGSEHQNLIKDYCFLLFGKRLTPQECFLQTFGKAACNKMKKSGNAYGILPQDESEAAAVALETSAMRIIFTTYAPMPPQTLQWHFQKACQIEYQDLQNRKLQGSISDLPQLVEKFDSCSSIPRRKIAEFNRLSSFAPMQLRSDIIVLSKTLSDVGFQPAGKTADEIKKCIANINIKLAALITVDQQLAAFEEELLPVLYHQRYVLDELFPAPPLPENVQKFIDQYEKY